MRTRTAQITLSMICLIVGIMLVIQFRTQTKIQRTILSEPATNQAMIINSLYDSNVELRKQVDDLEQQIEQYDRSNVRSDLTTMASELNRLRVVTGLSEATGPGVQLRTGAKLTGEDVRDLINELRNAGAEALDVNEQRVVAQTPVVGDSGIVSVNGQPLQAPYVFRAVGQPDTIDRALLRQGGVLAIVENAYPDAIFTVSKLDKLALPAYQPGYRWQYARPVEK